MASTNQTKPPSVTDLEIKRVLAEAKEAKGPLDLAIEPTGLLALKPLVPLEALVDGDQRLAALAAMRRRPKRG
jgi:hypothetical protein